ncbi:MAG TPA: hypothetical protein DEA85_07990 [Firmicutes bacterium]|jgi:hypothetical protein|nr:hypothetical protein [Bacillota bacterium]
MKGVVRPSIIVLSIILVVGLGFLAYRHIVPTVTYNHSIVHLFESLDEMEEKSDLIVEVSIVGKGRNVVRKGEAGFMDSYYTYTPSRVEKVYKGDIQPGDTIEVIEPVGYQRLPTGLYFIGREGYVPIKQNSYLLFLSKNIDGNYPVEAQGKFVWPSSRELSAENLEITGLDDHYKMLLDAVVAKYE